MGKSCYKGIFLLCILGVLQLIPTSIQMSEAQASESGGASRAADVVLVLDNSGSMKNNDPEFLMRSVVAQAVDGSVKNARIGMVIFDRSARLEKPLEDLADLRRREEFLQSLESIDYTGNYSDSPAAIERAIYELKANGRQESEKIIILLTDGIVDTGDKAGDIEKGQWLTGELAREAKAAGIRIFGIAFTDNADFRLMQSIAIKTGGDYFRAYRAEEITAIFNRIFQTIKTPNPENAVEKAAVDVADKETDSRSDPETAAKGRPTAAEKTALDQVEKKTAPTDSSATTKPKQPQPPGFTILLAGMAVLVGIIAIVFLLYRKKSGAASPDTGMAAPSVAKKSEAEIPGAKLADLNRVSGQKVIVLTRATTKIGRDKSNDIVIPNETVSSLHAVIEYKNGYFYLEDYGSKNKTRLNGSEVPPYSPMKLKSGDNITFNQFNFEFTLPSVRPSGETAMDFQDDDYTAVNKPDAASQHKPQIDKGPEEMPQAILVDVKNITGRKTIRLNRRIMKIGRGVHNDIVIKEKSISGSHAVIEFRDGEFFLEDYRSKNQTWLNGEGVTPHAPEKLKSGDEIVFDAYPFIFMLERQMPAGETGNRW